MKKLNNIKIAFVDIDGTLTNSKKEVTTDTTRAITKLKKKGTYIVLCSGRTNSYVCKMSKLANASSYVIACNGAEIYDYETSKDIFSNLLRKDDIKKLWEYCNRNDMQCHINTQDKRYTNKEDKDKVKIKSIDEIIEQNIYQIVAGHKNINIMKEMEKHISDSPTLKVANASSIYINKIKGGNGYFFDITNKDVSKGNAIRELLNYLNISKEDAIGFGDHINDYDLFNEVGFKVAMGNAKEKLKEKADYVTLTNDENGVADFINKYLLEDIN